MATVVHGDFEWDDEKAESNLAKHGVAFDEAVLAMKDVLSLDFDDLVEPDKLITLAALPDGRSSTLSQPFATSGFGSSAPARRPPTNNDAMKKQTEPSAESLEEMPEINDERFRRRAGRGHHADRSAGEIVTIDSDVYAHFGSAEAVNDALRQIVANKKAAGA